jgi:hypothetical protein
MALGDEDATGCSFGEMGNAVVEVNPPLLDAFKRLCLSDRAG